jgi:hypothetical protein
MQGALEYVYMYMLISKGAIGQMYEWITKEVVQQRIMCSHV